MKRCVHFWTLVTVKKCPRCTCLTAKASRLHHSYSSYLKYYRWSFLFLFLKSTEQVAAFCRSLHEMNPSDSSAHPQEFTGPQLATMRQLTDADKLRKVICELLETERTYVKVRGLNVLFQSTNIYPPSGKFCWFLF